MRRFVWPLMWKSDHEKVRQENYTLRDALREANKEVRGHRVLLGNLREGRPDALRAVERAMGVQK